MNLLEFQESINNMIDSIMGQGEIKIEGTEKGAEQIQVVIPLSEPSIGPVKTTEISGIGLGFDWNTGKLMVYTKDQVVRKDFEKKKAAILKKKYGINEIYYCSNCNSIIKASDHFCHMCGKQLVREE